ncbi:MAG: ribonuclease E/G [Pseudomonadota bacterium]
MYLPTVEHVGVSKRIGSARERARLRDVVEPMKPPTGGIIVRTVAEGLTKKSLKADIGYLVKLWEDVSNKKEHAKAPAILCTELDLVLKTARDLFHRRHREHRDRRQGAVPAPGPLRRDVHAHAREGHSILQRR